MRGWGSTKGARTSRPEPISRQIKSLVVMILVSIILLLTGMAATDAIVEWAQF